LKPLETPEFFKRKVEANENGDWTFFSSPIKTDDDGVMLRLHKNRARFCLFILHVIFCRKTQSDFYVSVALET